MLPQKPFCLFKRKKSYYVRFRLPDGSRSVPKSTGESARGRAEQWAIDYLRNGNGQIITKENVVFGDFSKDFFSWSGRWATDKKVRGLRISERQCIEKAAILKNHILPYFCNIKLSAIDRIKIKDFRDTMFNAGYGNTINKALDALKSILESAEERSLIQFVPKIERAASRSKGKGILTIDEVKKLFAVEWPDFRAYTASLLSASTGLRLGEVLGLVISDYHPFERYIHCHRSWDTKLRKHNFTTKSGRARNVIVPQHVCDAIDTLIAQNPYLKNDEPFIFYADKSSEYPTEPKIITDGFYIAMAQNGITDEARRRRNITFHSHRHFLNSLLINANIPLQKIQSITGHLTAEMSQHYYHLDEMGDVQKVQNELFLS